MTADASRSSPKHPRALVFDVDGTLIDTLGPMHRALNEVLAEAGVGPWRIEAVREQLSLGLDGLLDAALLPMQGLVDEQRRSLRSQLLSRYQRVAPLDAQAYPGADAALRRASDAGFRLAVCSNASGGVLKDLLTHFGWLSLFEVVVHADNARALKPSGQPLLQALEALEVSPDDAWLIGDSALDARCAQAAGCAFVWFSAGYGEPARGDPIHARVADHHALGELIFATRQAWPQVRRA